MLYFLSVKRSPVAWLACQTFKQRKDKFFYRFIFFSRTSLMAADFVMDRACRK